jgi:hypothetical protein
MASGPEKVFSVLAFHKTKSVVTVQRQFLRKYGKSPPSQPSIRAWYRGRKIIATVRSRHVGGRGRPQDDGIEGERTQSFPCIIRCETVSFRMQKNRNGGQLRVVNVFQLY